MHDADTHGEASQLDAVFHALSDARRRDMLARLSHADLSVKSLAEPLGLRLPAAIKHLAVLEAGGLVASEKTGRVRTYRIEETAFAAVNRWIGQREQALNAGFDRLEAAIAQMSEDERE